MVDLVGLRFFQRARTLPPVRAGVHQQGVVEPQAVERLPQAVVESRVALRPLPGGVGEAELVPAVADSHQGGRNVETAGKPGRHDTLEAPLDVQLAAKVRFQQPDVAEQRGAQLRAPRAKGEGELRFASGGPEFAAPGEAHREPHAGPLRRAAQHRLKRDRHFAGPILVGGCRADIVPTAGAERENACCPAFGLSFVFDREAAAPRKEDGC